MSFLSNFREGSNLILLNTMYERPKKINGKYTDKLHLVYKNIDENKKYLETIDNPELDIYFTNDDVTYDVLQPYISKDKVYPVTVPFKDVTRCIAEEADRRTGGNKYMDYFWRCLKEKKPQATKKLHRYRYVHSSDMDIEDYYRMRFLKEFKPQNLKISKSFLDIETDIKFSASNTIENMIKKPDAPINAVTIIHEDIKTAYTFLLRNPDNPQIEELENDIDNFIKELHEDLDEQIGEMKYNILFYDDEIELIQDLFRNINIIKPDFILIWNMGFDIQYIINRLIYLNVSPESVICHPDFTNKQCWYYKDNNHHKWEEKDDWFYCSSYTTYMDQMINFAKVNKGGSQLPSVSLDYISQKELGVGKLEFEGEFADFCWNDYRRFVKYNIIDVVRQVGIERNTEHLDMIFLRSYESATRLNKVFRQSVFLKNYAHIVYPEIGFILGNNHNIEYASLYEPDEDIELEKVTGKFIGAIVGNPLNNTNMGVSINGTLSKYIFLNCVDYDYSSLYPFIRDSHNIDITCQYGCLFIDEQISDLENVYNDEKYSRGGSFIDDFQTQMILTIGFKWFNLPTFIEVLNEIFKDNLNDIEVRKTIDLKDIKWNNPKNNEVLPEFMRSCKHDKFILKFDNETRKKSFRLKLLDDFLEERNINPKFSIKNL